MRLANRAHLIELVSALETGTLSRADVMSLFMIVREQARANSVVRDLADCIAHDTRNKGLALERVDAFATNIIDAALSGGIIHAELLYPVEEVLGQLHALFRVERIGFDLNAALRRRVQHTQAIAAVLDGVEFKVKHPLVARARLSAGTQPTYTFWPARLIKGGSLTLYPQVGLSGSLLMDV
ncbi:hypothetical protein [Clavibacter zhangzhiyongii]|uniref:hypothetical protein n=1 Tax=Clavibacter zhangzhiyongii TaxID=2768071 RepID=UPI0039DFBDF8